MTFLRISMYVLPSALLSLLVGSVVTSLGLGILSVFAAQSFSFVSILGIFGAGLFLTVFAVPLGFFVVLSFGVPAYALLVRFGIATYWSAAIVGALPGLILVAFKRAEFWPAFLVFGVVVALCTHFFAKRNMPLFAQGANYSLKRTAAGGGGVD